MLSVLGQGGGGASQIPWPKILQIAVVLIFVGFSALTWLFKKLNEQAAIKRAKEARLRERDDALRTGRVVIAPDGSGQAPSMGHAPNMGQGAAIPISENDARRRLQELAQRRRAELERLARQQSGGAAAPAPMQPPRPEPPLPQRRVQTEPPRRTVSPVMRPNPAGTGRVPNRPPGEQQRQQAARQREQAQLQAQRRREARPAPRSQPAEDPHEGESSTHRVVTDAPLIGAAAPPTPAQAAISAEMLRRAPLSDIRKAFVLSEILGRPVGDP